MIPRLLLAAFLLAPSARAGVVPDAPFDASAAGAFRAGQKEYLLALDGGRYRIADGRVVDGRTKVQLTNKQVADLLRGSAGGDRPVRAPVSGSGVKPTVMTSAVKKGVNFDGTKKRGGTVDGGAASGGEKLGTAALGDPALLKSRLIARLVFKGAPAETAAMEKAVDDILSTETGRELAARFIDDRASGDVVFQDIDGATLVKKDGAMRVIGMTGYTETTKSPPRVILSRLYLRADPPYRDAGLAGCLAHELFGHSLRTQEARAKKLPESVNYYYRGDEVGAELIDWLVQTEMRGEVFDDDPRDYLSDEEGYYRRLWPLNPYYALILSPGEMKDPVAALRSRRSVLDAARARAAGELEAMRSWRPAIDHLVKVHGVAKERFKPAEETISSYEVFAVDRLARMARAGLALSDQLKKWRTSAGLKEVAEIKAGASSKFIAGAEQELDARAATLKALEESPKGGGERSPTIEMPTLVVSAPAKGPAPIDFDALVKLVSEDQSSNPSHYGK